MNEKKELLKKIISEFQQSLPLEVIPRSCELAVNSQKIISVCGVRRSGKTFVMYYTINRLLASGVSKQNIIFLSFDDERLQFIPEELDFILQAYRELFPDTAMKDVYVFFDEIQMADGWEQFVRRIYDRETKNIFISGSNSKLLATDIATSLRGRTLQYEIFPLSFSEYCTFKNIGKDIYLSAGIARLNTGFMQYLTKGGFPELVLSDYAHFENVLQEYYHIMLYRDVIERYNVRNIPVLKYFISRLLSNLTKPTSINKIYNEIKSAGLKTDKNLLYELMDKLEAIYFTQRLNKYDKSVLKTELSTEKKNYFIDNGLVNALNYTYQDDLGKLFENVVFLWLRRQSPFQRGLYFYKGGKECDFVVLDRDKPAKLVQACWNINNEETIKREISGLTETARYLNCDDLTIITPDVEKEIKHNGLVIKICPAWKEMLK